MFQFGWKTGGFLSFHLFCLRYFFLSISHYNEEDFFPIWFILLNTIVDKLYADTK